MPNKYPQAIPVYNENIRGVGFSSRRRETKRLVIHHTAGASNGICPQTLTRKTAIDSFQTETGYGYHYFVERDGTVYAYIDQDLIAYHAGDVNGTSVSIALVACNDADVRPAQKTAAVNLGRYLMQTYGIRPEDVHGHGEFPESGKEATEGQTVAVALRGNRPPNNVTGLGAPRGSGTGGRARLPTGTNTGPQTPGISPYISANESFHPYIQYELTRRRVASETIHTHTPFVKLTSLVNVLNKNLEGGSSASTGSGAYCPSLGIVGIDQTNILPILLGADGGKSRVGYATAVLSGKTGQVPVLVESTDEDPPNIPPPGIVGMTCERTTAGGFGVRGGLFKANLNIKAYSVGQVNVLLRYFLRQGTKVVLEMGRMTSSPVEATLMETLELIQGKEMFQQFNWNRSQTEIETELGPLVRLEKDQREFIEKYTYGNLGNYEIFIGYVATFKINYTKENLYNIDLTIHSVQQFEVPTRLGGARSDPTTKVTVPNVCDPIDIMDYFSPKAGYRVNSFLQVLGRCTGDVKVNGEDNLPERWGNHVVKLLSAGAQVGANGLRRDGFMISWQCFVDLILNDEVSGLLGTFQLSKGVNANALTVLRRGLVNRIGNTRTNATSNEIRSNEVSWNSHLRSSDANVMIIYNKTAQSTANQLYTRDAVNALVGGGSLTAEETTALRESLVNSDVRNFITNNTEVGSFDDSGNNTGYLTSGVWINSNAIIEAFSDADTISMGITNLLNKMNDSVQGYWNLQLLSGEPESFGLHIIDSGLSKPVGEDKLNPIREDIIPIVDITDATTTQTTFRTQINQFGTLTEGRLKPNYLYAFNRKLRSTRSTTEGDTGSELLDIKYEADMPVVIAVQAIAGIGGTTQRGLLSSLDLGELRQISMFDTFVSPNEPTSTDTCAGIGPSRAAAEAGAAAPTGPTRRDRVNQALAQGDDEVLNGVFSGAEADRILLILRNQDNQTFLNGYRGGYAYGEIRESGWRADQYIDKIKADAFDRWKALPKNNTTRTELIGSPGGVSRSQVREYTATAEQEAAQEEKLIK
jgi:hypothetical protein